MKDVYKVNIINHILESMEKDEYYIARMKGDDTKAINIDKELLEIMRDYYSK